MSRSRASASRIRARARKSRVRTVADGIRSASAVSWHAHVFDVAHDEYRAEREGQIVDASLHDPAHLCTERGVRGRLDRLVGQFCRSSIFAPGRIVQRHHGGVPLLLPEPHECPVDDDAGEPGQDLRVAAKLPDVPVRIQIRILQRVFSIRIVAENGPRDAEKPLVVTPHQCLESCRVVRSHP